MSTNGRAQALFLNAATGVIAACALLLVALRVREAFFAQSSEPPLTTEVSDWRQFATMGHRLGPVHARVTIVEFADFQCPYCKAANATLQELLRRYPQDIAVIYRHYPMHLDAFPAAVAAECASEVGRFEEIHRQFYQTPDSIGKERWTMFALAAGVQDTTRFRRCMQSPSAIQRVIDDTLAARKLAIRGTPTFLINSLMITGFGGDAELTSYAEWALRTAQ